MHLQKDDIKRNFLVEDGKVIATVQVNGRWVSNPSVETLLKGGWTEYTPQPHIPSYEDRVVELIRQQYTLDAEFAILRQRDTKPEEFAKYNEYCEKCKQTARNEQNNA